MRAKDYRRIADQRCSYFAGRLAFIYFIYMIAYALADAISCGITTLLLPGPLLLSFIIISKKVYEYQEPDIDDLFTGIKEDFLNSFLLYLLIGLYTFLWSLLFIIPGIIKSYSYSMAFYIHNDNKELSLNECITKSRELMEGHKWELFCLKLSYLGWALLGMFTCGILYFWLLPKIQTAEYIFYLNISNQYQDIQNPYTSYGNLNELSTIEPMINIDELE